MTRHSRFRVLAVLALVLGIVIGMAGPAMAGTTDSGEIEVTATYAPRLEASFSGDIDLGEVDTYVPATGQWAEDYRHSPLGHWRVWVTSNLPYTSSLSLADTGSTGGMTLPKLLQPAGDIQILSYYRGASNGVELNNQLPLVDGLCGNAGVFGGAGHDHESYGWIVLRVPWTMEAGTMNVTFTITVSQII